MEWEIEGGKKCRGFFREDKRWRTSFIHKIGKEIECGKVIEYFMTDYRHKTFFFSHSWDIKTQSQRQIFLEETTQWSVA